MTKNKRRGGRPRKDNTDRKKVISVRMDSITRRHLERLAERARKNISDVLREAVKNGTIEKATYYDYLRSKTHLAISDVVGLLVINTHVMEAIPKEMVKNINNFYKASLNINEVARFARLREYDNLANDYEGISRDITQIREELRDFIHEYRYGKEVGR